MRLAAVVFAAIFFRHYAVDLIAQFYADPVTARKALFYIMAGVNSSLMLALIWTHSPWAPSHGRVAVACVCSWGIFEELQTSVCGAMAWASPIEAPMWGGLCDGAGIPLTMVGAVIAGGLCTVALDWLRGQDERAE